MKTVIGIDGGGTRTRAAVVGADGKVLGVGQAGGCNYHNVGADRAGEHIRHAARRAMQQASVERIGAAFAGLAGVGGERDGQIMSPIVAQAIGVPPDKLGLDHDMRIALHGALLGEPGVVLIAGTGSVCYGRNERGQEKRAGGWGPMFDDAGSAFDIGRRAVSLALRAADGRAAPTPLTARLRETLGDDLRAAAIRLSHIHDDAGGARKQVAALAPLVFDAAREGDGAAKRIIDNAAAELALLIEAVASALHFDRAAVPVAFAGGLVGRGLIGADAICGHLSSRTTPIELRQPALPPVLGAALLAMRSLGEAPTAAAVDQMRRTAPDGL